MNDNGNPADPFRAFSAAALRRRFFPRRRGAGPLLALVPWADTLLLAAAFAFFGQAAALVPGQTVDLPAGAFRDGAASSLVLVVRAAPGAAAAASAAADAPAAADAFFRDVRYRLPDAGREAALREALREASAASGEDTAVVYMDGALPHRDALRVCALARDAGLRRVLFAERPPAAAP
ncbi:MAG: hypothetical protein IJV65_02015 [Kiritimatiellae bacterium]|nr:hypothetical protein [Kiritimatiellia bacterium]